ncbi:hypothetical protein BGW80DRAFT_1259375 [Lactifluus volemus]|nr:hypothetical protein BGW80DRAFT_1259375 [Lactifluus volemus]
MPPRSSSASKKTSSKSPTKKILMAIFHRNKTSLEELVADETSANIVQNTSTSRISKRRAPSPVSSDSSKAYVKLEILGNIEESKRARRSPPPPGSPSFVVLPPGPMSGTDGGASIAMRSSSPSDVFDTPRRNVIKLEKAKVLEVESNKSSKRHASAVKVEDSESDVDFPPISTIIADAIAEKRTPTGTGRSSAVVEAIDNAAIINLELSPTLAVMNKINSPMKKKETVGGSTKSYMTVGDAVNMKDDTPQTTSDGEFSVMLVPCPDPVLATLYEGLPYLPRLCEVKPFSGPLDSLRTPFAAKCNGLGPETVNNHLRIAETKSMALCVMTGTVTESYLMSSLEAGPPNSPYAIHKVTIAPFEQDFRRDTSTWGLLFGFVVICGSISPAGFGFTTRGEGKGDSWRPSSASSSPVKGKSSVLRAVSSSLVSVSADIISRSFDEQVPVYDGRANDDGKGFTFSDAVFRNLSTWPLYKGGSVELPVDSIVSVIYTLGTYRGFMRLCFETITMVFCVYEQYPAGGASITMRSSSLCDVSIPQARDTRQPMRALKINLHPYALPGHNEC